MFSPATAASILNRRNQNRGQEQSSSVTSTRRTSPRLQPAAAHARGGASSSQGLLSGGTTGSRRGRGTKLTPTRHPLHPADCPLVQSIGGKHLLGHTPSLPSLTPLTLPAGAPLLLLILLRPQKGQRGHCTLLRGRGVLFTTLMMVVINMIMRTILSQPPMDQSRLQPKTLRTTCSLLKKQQNSLRSTAKNS